MSVVSPPEHVNQGIPVDEFSGGVTACREFFLDSRLSGVSRINVCEFVRERAAALDLQQVDF